MRTNTTHTSNTTNIAGVPPAPPEAHQRPDRKQPEQREFRIEASTRNPCDLPAAECGDVSIVRTASRQEANQVVRSMAPCYWIEVFEEPSGELIAGPFDPDQNLPTTLF